MATKSRRKSALAALVHPLTPERFKADYWPGRGFVNHGPLRRFDRLAGIRELQDPEALVSAISQASHPNMTVEVWFTNTEGGFTNIPIAAADAKAYFSSGKITLVANNIGAILPPVAAFIEQVAEEIGAPQSVVLANAYIAAPGVGTRMHFDSQENFFLQTHGSKRWAIAHNEQINYPPKNFVFQEGSLYDIFSHDPFPVRMPENAVRTVLKPGSVAFIPRGHWHESKASSQGSVHVTLSFETTSWSQLFMQSLRYSLTEQEQWRMPASDVLAENERLKLARANFEKLREDLQRQLAALKFNDLLRYLPR